MPAVLMPCSFSGMLCSVQVCGTEYLSDSDIIGGTWSDSKVCLKPCWSSCRGGCRGGGGGVGKSSDRRQGGELGSQWEVGGNGIVLILSSCYFSVQFFCILNW